MKEDDDDGNRIKQNDDDPDGKTNNEDEDEKVNDDKEEEDKKNDKRKMRRKMMTRKKGKTPTNGMMMRTRRTMLVVVMTTTRNKKRPNIACPTFFIRNFNVSNRNQIECQTGQTESQTGAKKYSVLDQTTRYFRYQTRTMTRHPTCARPTNPRTISFGRVYQVGIVV